MRDGDEATAEGSRAVVVIVETKDDPLSYGQDDFYKPRVYKDNTVTEPVTSFSSTEGGSLFHVSRSLRGLATPLGLAATETKLIFGGKKMERDKEGGGSRQIERVRLRLSLCIYINK